MATETTPDALGGGQSPLNLSGAAASDAPAPRFAYAGRARRVERGPGFAMFHFEPGSRLTVGVEDYQLLQFHWHTPAEHAVEGELHAAELHFVHSNAQEQLLVVGAVYALGEADPGLQQIIDAARSDEAPTLAAADHVPAADGFYHYSGSLTTPPFSEPVRWYVGRTLRTLSARQAEQLQALCGGPNARPLQDRNGRALLCVGC